MDEAEIQQRINNTPKRQRRYIQPFANAGQRLQEWLVNDEGRFMLGLREVDAMIRGIGPGELAYVIGRPHSGKTQVVLNALANNPDRRVLFFTPDENDVMILTKLIALAEGINVIELERLLKEHDKGAIETVRRVAEDTFRNLFVIDKPLTFSQMTEAKAEAEDYWGDRTEIVVGDFLELFPGEGGHDGIIQLSQNFKGWLKNENVAGLILHQSSRTGGERGKSNGMDAMRYGGESEAIYVLEVFRKREQFNPSSPADYDKYESVKDLITVNVAKNKRPPSQTGEVDYHMDAATGRIRELQDVLPKTGLTQHAQETTMGELREMFEHAPEPKHAGHSDPTVPHEEPF